MHESSKPTRAIIVGAGMLGLTAALRLAQAGTKVTLLERDESPGGLCRGFDAGDIRADRFHHFVTGADRSLISLIRELDLERRLKWKSARTASLTDKGIVPLSGAVDLLRFPGVPLIEKLRFGFAVNALTRFTNWQSLEAIPAAEWIRTKGGLRLYDRMWKDLFEKKFEGKVDEIPLSWFWARLRRRMSRRQGAADLFGVLEGSLGILIDAIGVKIREQGGQVHLETEVEQIVRAENGFSVNANGNQRFQADRVLVTTPLSTFVRMTPDLDEDLKTKSGDIEYSGIVNAVFVLKKSLSDYFWINVNREGLPFLGIIQTTSLLEKPEKHLVYLPRYRPSDHPDFSRNANDLLDDCEKGLRTVFPTLKEEEIVSRHLFREPLADPFYTLNYSECIVPHRTNLPGLYCFNTAQIYPDTRSANSSIAFGEKAAAMILEGDQSHE